MIIMTWTRLDGRRPRRTREVSSTRFTDADSGIKNSRLMRSLQEGGRYGQSINKPTYLYSQLPVEARVAHYQYRIPTHPDFREGATSRDLAVTKPNCFQRCFQTKIRRAWKRSIDPKLIKNVIPVIHNKVVVTTRKLYLIVFLFKKDFQSHHRKGFQSIARSTRLSTLVAKENKKTGSKS